MSRVLDSCYFRATPNGQRTSYGHVFTVHDTVPPGDELMEAPQVLVSLATGEHLATFHTRCQDSNGAKRGRAILVERRDSDRSSSTGQQHFQCLVSAKDQEIEFVMTNLTHQYLGFKINQGETTINYIDELTPGQSYAVKCDQATKRAFVLREAEKAVSAANPSIKKPVKISEDEKEAPANRMATRLTLHVIPVLGNTAMAAAFAKTEWRTLDQVVYVYPVPDQTESFEHERGASRGRGGARGYIPESTLASFALMPEGAVPSMPSFSFGASLSAPGSASASASTLASTSKSAGIAAFYAESADPRSIGTSANSSRRFAPYPIHAPAATEEDLDSELQGSITRSISIAVTASVSSASSGSHDFDEENLDDEDELMDLQSFTAPKSKSKKSKTKGKKGSAVTTTTPPTLSLPLAPASASVPGNGERIEEKDLQEAVAGILSATGREIHEKGRDTDIQYDPSLASRPCVLTLSVASHLNFPKRIPHHLLPTKVKEQLKAQTQTLLDMHIRKQGVQLLQNLPKKFLSEECAVCRETEPGPNVVLLPCAHQCFHDTCDNPAQLILCPICRARISMRLSVDQAVDAIGAI